MLRQEEVAAVTVLHVEVLHQGVQQREVHQLALVHQLEVVLGQVAVGQQVQEDDKI